MSGRPFAASYDADTSTLTLSGIVDELSIAEMQDAVDAATADHTRSVTVDLSDLDFLPSIGLGVLAVAMRRHGAGPGGLRLVTRPGTLAQRVLEISGLPVTLL